jgi:hypothetical protein
MDAVVRNFNNDSESAPPYENYLFRYRLHLFSEIARLAYIQDLSLTRSQIEMTTDDSEEVRFQDEDQSPQVSVNAY